MNSFEKKSKFVMFCFELKTNLPFAMNRTEFGLVSDQISTLLIRTNSGNIL